MDTQPPLAGFSSDFPESYDALGIEQKVNAFAALISSRQVAPPLSIGLFGTEGSGKSFFSHRLADRISWLTTHVEPVDETSSAYCSRVVQIRYNAWHYMGANQWLGLAEKIFVELAQWEADRGQGDRIFIPIRTADKSRRELESKLTQANNVRHDTEVELTLATEEHERPSEFMQKTARSPDGPRFSKSSTSNLFPAQPRKSITRETFWASSSYRATLSD